jgi:hypothetical protein
MDIIIITRIVKRAPVVLRAFGAIVGQCSQEHQLNIRYLAAQPAVDIYDSQRILPGIEA